MIKHGQREATYTIEWLRLTVGDEVLVCKGVTARVAFKRLISALAHGPILIRAVKRDGWRVRR